MADNNRAINKLRTDIIDSMAPGEREEYRRRSQADAAKPSDADRWRFLADNHLVLNRSKSEVSIMQYTQADDAGQAPRFTSVATGQTADEAIDAAIARWEKKHGKKIGS